MHGFNANKIKVSLNRRIQGLHALCFITRLSKNTINWSKQRAAGRGRMSLQKTMLFINYQIIFRKKFHHLIMYDFFHNFSARRSKGDWPVITSKG